VESTGILWSLWGSNSVVTDRAPVKVLEAGQLGVMKFAVGVCVPTVSEGVCDDVGAWSVEEMIEVRKLMEGVEEDGK